MPTRSLCSPPRRAHLGRAVTVADRNACYFGASIDLVPSFQVFSLESLLGTSMAAPHLAAVAALLVSQGINDSALVKAAIENTAEDLGPSGFDNEFDHGVVRPAEALRGLGLGR